MRRHLSGYQQEEKEKKVHAFHLWPTDLSFLQAVSRCGSEGPTTNAILPKYLTTFTFLPYILTYLDRYSTRPL